MNRNLLCANNVLNTSREMPDKKSGLFKNFDTTFKNCMRPDSFVQTILRYKIAELHEKELGLCKFTVCVCVF